MRRYTLVLSFLFAVLIAGSVIADEDPIIFYDSFLKVSTNAKSLDELKPYLSQKNVQEMGQIPKEEEESILSFIKEMRQSMKRESITSKVDGNNATLTIKAVSTEDGSKIDGTVLLVKENGSWKIDNEDFTSNVEVQ